MEKLNNPSELNLIFRYALKGVFKVEDTLNETVSP